MKKILKKWGNALGILVNKEEQKIYDLKEGSIVEVDPNKVNIIFKDKEEIDWKDLREKVEKNDKGNKK